MKTSNACYSVLLAGLLATVGAHAQTVPASPVSEAPIATKDAIRQDAHGMSDASTTARVPVDAGEASTVVQGKPNANPNDPNLGKSRAEVRSEVRMSRAEADAARATQMMGHARYGVSVGVPATVPADSLSVFEGGTPK